MPGLSIRVRDARIEKRWNQTQLAAEVTRQGFKIGQSGIGNIESGRSKSPKCIAALAAALGVSFQWLTTGKGEKVTPAVRQLVHTSVMSGTAPLQNGDTRAPAILLWRSGPDAGPAAGTFMLNQRRGRAIERPAELVNRDKAFCFLLVGRDNEPAYFAGDRLDVDPEKTVEPGRDYLFLQQAEATDDTPSTLGQLKRITEKAWVIYQYAYPIESERELPRDLWPFAWKIVGRRHRE